MITMTLTILITTLLTLAVAGCFLWAALSFCQLLRQQRHRQAQAVHQAEQYRIHHNAQALAHQLQHQAWLVRSQMLHHAIHHQSTPLSTIRQPVPGPGAGGDQHG